MKIVKSKDRTVFKYLFEDTPEIILKKKKNKYVLFLPSSFGCPLKCKHCYLTIESFKYEKLNKDNLIKNIKQVIKTSTDKDSSIKELPIRLSWMGTGDAMFNMDMCCDVSIDIFNWVKNEGFATETNMVDFSTAMPDIKKSATWLDSLDVLKTDIEKNFGESKIRVFYSLHSLDDEIKQDIMPKSQSVTDSVMLIRNTSKSHKTFIHYVPFKDVNDSEKDFYDLSKIVEMTNSELRIVPYNAHKDSVLEESETSDNIISVLNDNNISYSVLDSKGKDIESACGQSR